MSYYSSKSSKIYLLCLWLTLTLATISAAQTLVIPGGTVIDGNVIVPAPPQAPPAILPFLFGMEEHSISTPAAYPTIPFGAYRQYGTNCQWNTMWTGSGDNYNFACFLAQLNYADLFNVPLMFTFGQVPSAFSTINPDNTLTVPAQFPVAINGVTLNCTSGSCSATVTTLQRQNVAVGDSLTLTGAVGCPESPNGTFNATVANNPTDYPWTYTFNIGAGSTSSSACGGNAMFLADNAQKASLCSGTPAGPTQAGGCYSTADIDINGVGTDAHLISFLTQLLAYDAANDPHHRLAHIEVWNEPQGRGFFNGSIAQTARMAKDMYTVIQASAVASFVQLTSPAPSGGLTSPANYLGLYAADPSNPLQYACCINNHTYNFPAGAGTPDPMSATTIAANVRAAVAPFPAAAGKPQFATEGSWGFGPFGASSTNIGPNTGTAAGADKAGWASVAYMAHQCAGYKVYMFFAWDQMCNTGLACATPPPPFSISPAGIAYGITHDVLTGTTVSQTCTKDTSNNWTLNLQRGTYNVKALWNLNLISLGSYTIPAGVYSDYRDVSGNVNSIGPTQTTVPVQYDPIFLETGNPPFRITNTLPLPNGVAGVSYSQPITYVGNTGTVLCKERSLPSQLAVLGLILSGCNITGATPTAGTIIPQIGILDPSGVSYALNVPITIQAAAALITTNPACPSSGTVGSVYTCTLTASGGTPPYTWSLLSGANPSGTTLSTTSNVGTVAGTLTTAQTVTPVYKVTDALAATALAPIVGAYSITISAAAGGADNRYCNTSNVWTGGATDGVSTLPTSCINTALSNAVQTTPTTVTVTAGSSSDLQTKLTALTCGETLKIPAKSGSTQWVYTGNFTLPAIVCPQNNWIIIESDQVIAGALGTGNPEGTRATPAYIGLATLPQRPAYGLPLGGAAILMPKILSLSTGAVKALDGSAGISSFRFIGIEFTTPNGTAANNSIVDLGLCQFCVLDRVLIHGGNGGPDGVSWKDQDNIHIGVQFSSSHSVAIVDSTLADIHTIAAGSACVDWGGRSAVGEGPSKFVDNFCESSDSSFIAGGGGSGVTTLPTSNGEVRRNHLFKPLFWKNNDGTYFGTSFTVKNHVDLKNANKWLFEGNIADQVWGLQSDQLGFVFEWNEKNQSLKMNGKATSDGAGNLISSGCTGCTGNFGNVIASTCATPGQCQVTYNAITYKAIAQIDTTHITVTPAPPVSATAQSFAACQAGTNPNAAVSNITARYNYTAHSARGFDVGSGKSDCGDVGAGGFNLSLHDNVLDDMDGGRWEGTGNACCTWGLGFAVNNQNPIGSETNHISIIHNTVIPYLSVTGGTGGLGPIGISGQNSATGTGMGTMMIRDNIMPGGIGNTLNGICTAAFTAERNWACWTGAKPSCFDHNVQAAATVGTNTYTNNNTPLVQGPDSDATTCGFTPTGNLQPTNYAAIDFVSLNGANGGNYQLCTGVGTPDPSCAGASPYHNASSDGIDMGANWALVQSNIQGVIDTPTSTTQVLTNPNTPTCTGNGIPDAGCNAAFTALSTDGANTNAQTQVIGPAPGNMSTLPTRNYLYSGATTEVRAYYQPWFRNDGGGSHINIGMDESNPATIAQQAAAMVAMGVDVINIDYYGTAATHAFLKTVTDAWTTYLTANPSVSLKQEIMLDQGALLPFCTDTLTVWSGVTAYTTGQGVTFSGHSYIALSNNTNKQPDTNPAFWQVMETCILNAMETQLDTIDSAYGSKSTYSKDSSGRPFLFLFITPANWANTDFAGTIYPAFLTYAHAHYTGRVYQVMDRFGAFGANFDGEYAWIQPPLYVNASPTSQKCWDDIVGGACNWATGVGGGTSYLNTFYTACRANPTKHCIGMLSKGFDWTHANWLTSPKIVQQGLANVPQLMAAKVAANGYSSSSQLEGIGWVTWNDYEEETAMEMGIDNGARPTVSISAPNQLGWLENPTDVTYFSENTIDHWEIWYANTGSSNLIQAFTGIAPSVSTEIISTLVPVGTHDVYLYMVGKPGIMNRLAGPVSYTH